MFKRTLMTAIAALGATMSFATMHTAGAIKAAKLMLVVAATNELKITEALVNPQGTDNGNEYFEIRNTSNNDQELNTVHFVYLDGELSQQGEVDARVCLGDDGSGGIGGTGSRVIAANSTMVFRDKNGSSSPDTISPQGGTVVQVDFENTTGLGELHNSLGMFALIEGPNVGFDAGDNLDTNSDGTLDSTPWTNTLHVVDLKRASNESGSEAYYSDGGLPDPADGNTGYNRVKIDQQSTWTPDGFSLMKNDSSGLWDNAVIFDTNSKNGSNQFTPDTTTPEYKFGVVANAGGYTGQPITVSGTVLCTPGLINQFTVRNSASTVSYTH